MTDSADNASESDSFIVFPPCTDFQFVMPGLMPGIHVLAARKDVDGRDKPGHDAW
jgi:hypothetical protein